MTLIAELQKGASIEGFYAVYSVEEREFNNKPGKYLQMELGDKSGRTVARFWDWEQDDLSIADIPVQGVIKLRGTAQEYQGQNQIIITRLRPAKPEEYELSDFVPESPQSRERVIERIDALRSQLENRWIIELTNAFLDDPVIFDGYLRASAAERNHHAYIRGLAEHSCNVTEVALSIANHYPELDRDQLIFGGLFHDYGKIASYDIAATIQYSLEGRLVDHISIADAEITAKARAIDDFPTTLLAQLRHLILSHHGERMFGSPVEPKTAEAMILNYADLIDSRMEMTRESAKQIDSAGWGYSRALRKNIFFGDSPRPYLEADENPDRE